MNNENKTNINWYPGHMAKTKREIKEKIDLIDIVFEVVDARIPYSSKNKEIEEMTKGKPRVIVMTKIDLCDSGKTNKWIKYYEDKDYIVIPMDLINSPNTKIIFDKIKPLVDEINNKRKSKGLKERKARILIMGVPNVGKSTLINRLVGRKATNVGNRPGVTKNLEWIRINDKVELLDTPGILWPKFEDMTAGLKLAFTGAINDEAIDRELITEVFLDTMLELYPARISERYKITDGLPETALELLELIGKKRGCLMKGGVVDTEKAQRIVLTDFRSGKLGTISLDVPPLSEETENNLEKN